MPKPLKDITEIPFASCPLCDSTALTVVTGKPTLFGLLKKPDAIECGECGAMFKVAPSKTHISLDFIPNPYSFFDDSFEGWVATDDAAHLGELIRTNSPEALSYLSDVNRYVWRVRLITGSTGPIEKLETSFEYDTEGEAKQQLARIRQLQKEIRQVKREMRLDMKEIRAKYGRKKEMQSAKKAALWPYEHLEVTIDGILVQIDRIKLEIQT
jgi:hypothetical protein